MTIHCFLSLSQHFSQRNTRSLSFLVPHGPCSDPFPALLPSFRKYEVSSMQPSSCLGPRFVPSCLSLITSTNFLPYSAIFPMLPKSFNKGQINIGMIIMPKTLFNDCISKIEIKLLLPSGLLFIV